MSGTDPNAADAAELADKVHEATSATLRAQSYRLPDGTQITRPSLRDLTEARRALLSEDRARSRGGLYRRVGFA